MEPSSESCSPRRVPGLAFACPRQPLDLTGALKEGVDDGMAIVHPHSVQSELRGPSTKGIQPISEWSRLIWNLLRELVVPESKFLL